MNRTEQEIKRMKLAHKVRHEMRMRALAHEGDGIKLHIDTLRAIRKHARLMDLLMNGFTKTKKLTKSFFNKPVNLSRNVF